MVSSEPREKIAPMAWMARIQVNADGAVVITGVRFVFSSEQLVYCRVERWCVCSEIGLSVEDPECFLTDEFAGEEECWLWNAVLSGHHAPIGLAKGVFVDANP